MHVEADRKFKYQAEKYGRSHYAVIEELSKLDGEVISEKAIALCDCLYDAERIKSAMEGGNEQGR